MKKFEQRLKYVTNRIRHVECENPKEILVRYNKTDNVIYKNNTGIVMDSPMFILNATCYNTTKPFYVNITLHLDETYLILEKLWEDWEIHDKALGYNYVEFFDTGSHITACLQTKDGRYNFLNTKVDGFSSEECIKEIEEYIPIYEGAKIVKIVKNVSIDRSRCVDKIITLKFYD